MKLRLDGAQSALLMASLFALHLWEFESDAAREMVPRNSNDEIARLYQGVSVRWRSCLVSKGIWQSKTGRWTRELIAKRALITCEFELSRMQAQLAVIALDTVAEEFRNNWGELCAVLPGALDWYQLNIDDVGLLARSIERAGNGDT